MFKCCTFGTMGAKSAIKVAGKGLGYDKDEIATIASMIKVERGDTYSITEMMYGDEEKERQADTQFKNLIESYDGLLELALKLEGLKSSIGTHASGMFMVNGDLTKYGSVMRSPDGTLVSAYDLHTAESMGLLKYDLM